MQRRKGTLGLVLLTLFMFVFSSFYIVSIYSAYRVSPMYKVKTTRRRLEKVARALYAYASETVSGAQQPYIKRNRFPDSLDTLVALGYITKDDLYDGWRRKIQYYTINNPSASGSCLYSLVQSGAEPVAVVVSLGADGVLNSNPSAQVQAGDDLMVRVGLASLSNGEYANFSKEMEYWAQMISNYWLINWYNTCVNTDTPDTNACCDPTKSSSCQGPATLFPADIDEAARIIYGSTSDSARMVDLTGNRVSYVVTGFSVDTSQPRDKQLEEIFGFRFDTSCPNTSFTFHIPESVWRY